MNGKATGAKKKKPKKKNLPTDFFREGSLWQNAKLFKLGRAPIKYFVSFSFVRCGGGGIGVLVRAAIGRVLALRGRMLMADRAVCLINF